jgi:glycosyltransferase involved in cell wall biosynthesis
VDVVIAAASYWSKHAAIDASRIPSNVKTVSLDYAALRELYSQSLFVVVPLHDVDNQAGITTILEAMSMGMAVVVSHSRGQVDIIRDRRSLNRLDSARPTQPKWVGQLGADETVADGQTGIYVMPGNTADLRRAIQFLLDHPEKAAEMGANGRRIIETSMSLDHYVRRVAAVIRGGTSSHGTSTLSAPVDSVLLREA